MQEGNQGEVLRQAFAAAGQGQVFAFWDQLDAAGRQQLLAQAGEIDLAEVAHLVATLVRGGGAEAAVDYDLLRPAPYVARPEHGGDAAAWAAAHEAGAAALAAGRVAAFTVAGGQGTRLGYDGPKGTFPVTPVRRATLFQVFAEKIRAASRRHGRAIPWFLMTSDVNDAATREFFAAHNHFGLAADDVVFFRQGRMPAVDADGKILLEAPDRIALSPDGHGGALRALVRSGATARMAERGIDLLSYFQVDNPLVMPVDPAFIGFHLLGGSEMSSKMIPKAYAGEKVGHFCVAGDGPHAGNVVVIEYSDLPAPLAERREPDGTLTFRAGSIAIHVLNRDFVERMGGNAAGQALPFHRADKKVPTIDAAGRPVIPTAPNAVKFEMFVFDALPFARAPVVIETRREEEFSPVKNATGIDSAETCERDQLSQWSRWAAAAGVAVPQADGGGKPAPFEVTPLFADSAAALAEAVARTGLDRIAPGTVLDA